MGLLLALCVAVPSLAAQAEGAEPDVASLNRPAERRAGVVIGVAPGAGVAALTGYPNNPKYIGNPAAYATSGAMIGGDNALMLMGALADMVNFGIWYGASTHENDTWRSDGRGIGFRVEGFPLYGMGGGFRDFGFAGQFGVGFSSLRRKDTGEEVADGAQSFIGFGPFYEWNLGRGMGGHFALGPFAQYNLITARSIDRHSANFGLRLAFYGGK